MVKYTNKYKTTQKNNSVHTILAKFPKRVAPCRDGLLTFREALNLHMRRRKVRTRDLCKAILIFEKNVTNKTIRKWNKVIYEWRNGTSLPKSSNIFALRRIERHFGLPINYFKRKLRSQAETISVRNIIGFRTNERQKVAWYLPSNFDYLTKSKRKVILDWIKSNIFTISNDYASYQSKQTRHAFAIDLHKIVLTELKIDRYADSVLTVNKSNKNPLGPKPSTIKTPPALAEEIIDFVRFKTDKLTRIGFKRLGIWTPSTALLTSKNFGLFFGAMVASPTSLVRGLGIPLKNLTFALFVFPSIWDWYLKWRFNRRGFYGSIDHKMHLMLVKMVHSKIGWLRQSPNLAKRLCPIPGLLTLKDIKAANEDWQKICDIAYEHGKSRARDLKRLMRVHRDPFEPINVILEHRVPLAEYKKIGDEILRLMPNEKNYPIATAETVRSYLIFRIALHLGVRQKNLRQLLFCPRNRKPTLQNKLIAKKRGEIRWNNKRRWEVFIPRCAFKNEYSSFFNGKHFQLTLPDTEFLYYFIERYINKDRKILIGEAQDAETFFVKTARCKNNRVDLTQADFYKAWRRIIERYGIYNPYTGNGAIKGLKPHGPHAVRDILATHILKSTGSYILASYAIQDAPSTLQRYYAQFLPENKSAIAAQTLNQVWLQ